MLQIAKNDPLHVQIEYEGSLKDMHCDACDSKKEDSKKHFCTKCEHSFHAECYEEFQEKVKERILKQIHAESSLLRKRELFLELSVQLCPSCETQIEHLTEFVTPAATPAAKPPEQRSQTFLKTDEELSV